MYNTDFPACTKCKGKTTVPLYCCNPSQFVCIRCSLETCKKCRHRRTHTLPSDFMLKKEPKMTKIIRCDECFEPQSLTPTEFYYESKCKVYYCHCCMVKFYNLHEETVQKIGGDSDKIDLPVELKCGCELSRKETLDYLKPFCYYCSQVLTGNTILLKNSCKISLNCYSKIKRLGQSFIPSQDESRIWKFIQENTIYCMNCELMIDGQIKTFGDKIDGFYVCSLCLDSSNITEKAFNSRKKSEEAFRQLSEIKKKQIENDKQLNYSSSKRQPLENKVNQQVKVKIEQAKKDKEGSVKQSIKSQSKQRKPIELGKRNKPHLMNGSKYFQTRCKDCRIGIQKRHGEESICEDCEKKKKPQLSVESTVSKDVAEEKSTINECIKVEQFKQNPTPQQQEKIPLLEDNLDKQLIKKNGETANHQQQQVKDEEKVEIPIISMKELTLQSKQSSTNQQFLPLKVQKLKIPAEASSKQTKCSKCNFIIQEQNQYRAYQKQPGNAGTLRIAEEQSEIQKYTKEKRLFLICTACYLSLKLKAAQQKKAQDQASIRHRSLSHKPKKEESALTYTNVKKVEERRHMKPSDSLCHQCYQWVPATQLNKDRKCKNCQQIPQIQQTKKPKCRRCLRQLSQILDKPNIHDLCRYCMVNISLV